MSAKTAKGWVVVFALALAGCAPGMTNEQIIAADAYCKEAGMDTHLIRHTVFSHRPEDAVCVPRTIAVTEEPTK